MRRFVLVALAALATSLAPTPPPAWGEPDIPGAGDPVVGISVRGTHRAYPTALFTAQQVVNDVIDGMEVAVFHDPALGFSSAWFRLVLGESIEFSGSAAGAVADDLTTITRWDLTTGVAVAGSLQGQRLVPLDLTMTSWAGWAELHPNAQVFSGSR